MYKQYKGINYEHLTIELDTDCDLWVQNAARDFDSVDVWIDLSPADKRSLAADLIASADQEEGATK